MPDTSEEENIGNKAIENTASSLSSLVIALTTGERQGQHTTENTKFSKGKNCNLCGN